MKTLIYFVGIDEWNRPVFKCIASKLYFCDTENLFKFDITEKEIVERYKQIGTGTICYKGKHFNSEPEGDGCDVEVVTKEHADKAIIDVKYGRVDIFERVEEFPAGYFVWNIGRQNFAHEKCVPLAKDGYNPESWMRNIDPDNLKYIEVESEELALMIINKSGHCNRFGADKFYKIVKEYKNK